jgi:hypothetical protein
MKMEFGIVAILSDSKVDQGLAWTGFDEQAGHRPIGVAREKWN